MKIALCDEDPLARDHTMALVQDYLQLKQMQAQLFCFDNSRQLLEAACRNGGFDLYLLETQLPDASGIQTGFQLRQLGFEGSIVYISARADDALEAFRVRAEDYLLKPPSRQELTAALERGLSTIKRHQEPQLLLKTRNSQILVPYSQILYGELVKKAVIYHLLNGQSLQSTCIRTPFSEAVQPLLEDRHFLLCGSAHVVNLHHIRQLSKEELVFCNGQNLYIGKGASGKIRPAWLRYLQSNDQGGQYENHCDY